MHVNVDIMPFVHLGWTQQVIISLHTCRNVSVTNMEVLIIYKTENFIMKT